MIWYKCKIILTVYGRGTFLNVFSRVIKRFLLNLFGTIQGEYQILVFIIQTLMLHLVHTVKTTIQLIFSQYIRGLNGGIKFVVVVVVVVTTIALG